ncbi:MAG: Asp-tRNA(Asn)/Glu-tRNA(Gln) amidotransferase subunit GatB [Planctomycetes bacterium]|nr:Asp-tRNA(Asn)/Glu-tRNA(Gln) amidotransferase subunit GatB [Planctomycetota bacterium]
MAAAYKTIIGLEVHVQLLTRTKLFCGCATRFGASPNSQVCQVCLGLPGALPVMNRTAFELSLRAALALNCEIAAFTKWDRKNYYYPDLPKNFQISQYDLPFSSEGWLEINAAADPKKEFLPKRIGIIRAHLEEDAGKSIHDESGRGGDSKVDLNRTGTPLLEIVSKPEMESAEEAKAFLEEIRLMLREIGVSDCEMQEGSLRCDANVNVKVTQPDGSWAATPIVEIKNLNSIGSVERSIRYEAQRQYEQFLKDKITLSPGNKTTAGWNDDRGITKVQRTKEESADYRYFPDPDLVPVLVSPAEIDHARAAMGELPAQQRKRLQDSPFTLSAYDAGVLTAQGRHVVAYFEAVASKAGDAKAACNWIANDVLASLRDRDEEIDRFPVSAERLGNLVLEVKKTGLPMNKAREVYADMLANGGEAGEVMKKLGFQVVSDEGQLREIIRKAIGANAQAVADFKAGKVKAADRIKGAVMKETKGMANAETVNRLLVEELSKSA